MRQSHLLSTMAFAEGLVALEVLDELGLAIQWDNPSVLIPS